MAVMQRLRCSANCGAPQFDAMVERRIVGEGDGRCEELVIIDKSLDRDGFPSNREVAAICTECGSALQIRMMAFVIGGRARAVAERENSGGLRIELGPVVRHVGKRCSFHHCDSGEVFEATVQGPLVAPQGDENGPKLVEVGGVAVRDDGRAFDFGQECEHGTGSGQGPSKVTN